MLASTLIILIVSQSVTPLASQKTSSPVQVFPPPTILPSPVPTSSPYSDRQWFDSRFNSLMDLPDGVSVSGNVLWTDNFKNNSGPGLPEGQVIKCDLDSYSGPEDYSHEVLLKTIRAKTPKITKFQAIYTYPQSWNISGDEKESIIFYKVETPSHPTLKLSCFWLTPQLEPDIISILSSLRFVDITSAPTCRPRPTCLDQEPRCLMPETADMCPATSLQKCQPVENPCSPFSCDYDPARCKQTYTCPGSEWVDCMPGPGMDKLRCQKDYLSWMQENCQGFNGAAY